MEHKLKIDDVYKHRREQGIKPFEIRYNDRDYQVGDTVSFSEYGPKYLITYIHTGYGMKDGFVCMTLKELK